LTHQDKVVYVEPDMLSTQHNTTQMNLFLLIPIPISISFSARYKLAEKEYNRWIDLNRQQTNLTKTFQPTQTVDCKEATNTM
jgi:hypothetical protein